MAPQPAEAAMAESTAVPQPYAHLIRLIRVARALESGGIYNAARLFWAAAFSHELRAAMQAPIAPEALHQELREAVGGLAAAGVSPGILAAAERGRQGALENRTIPRTDIPEVAVCRDCGEILLGPVPERCPSCGARAVTFREFPPVYYLEPLAPQQALDLLASAPDELERIVAGLDDEHMGRSPGPGRWALCEVLAHLLVAHELLAGRIERILDEDNPPLRPKAAWKIADDPALPAREILGRFRASRQATLARLLPLRLEQWFRTGEHEEFGRVTLIRQASYFARHERYHMPRMEATRRLIEAQGSPSGA